MDEKLINANESKHIKVKFTNITYSQLERTPGYLNNFKFKQTNKRIFRQTHNLADVHNNCT